MILKNKKINENNYNRIYFILFYANNNNSQYSDYITRLPN